MSISETLSGIGFCDDHCVAHTGRKINSFFSVEFVPEHEMWVPLVANLGLTILLWPPLEETLLTRPGAGLKEISRFSAGISRLGAFWEASTQRTFRKLFCSKEIALHVQRFSEALAPDARELSWGHDERPSAKAIRISCLPLRVLKRIPARS